MPGKIGYGAKLFVNGVEIKAANITLGKRRPKWMESREWRQFLRQLQIDAARGPRPLHRSPYTHRPWSN